MLENFFSKIMTNFCKQENFIPPSPPPPEPVETAIATASPPPSALAWLFEFPPSVFDLATAWPEPFARAFEVAFPSLTASDFAFAFPAPPAFDDAAAFPTR